MSLRHATTCHYHSRVHLKLRSPLKCATLFVLIFFLTCTVIAQTKTDPVSPPFNTAVYRVGEHLTYNVNYSQFVSVAHIELLVAGRGKFFEHEGVQLKAHVETTGVINV